MEQKIELPSELEKARSVAPLAVEQLVRTCDPAAFDFATTAELEDVDLMVTQERARAALDFGAEVSAHGFNVFVVGSSEESMEEAVRTLLRDRAGKSSPPSDWVYLNNFVTPHRPIAQELPPGRAPAFHEAIRNLVEDLRIAVPGAFESEDYQARRAAIEQAFAQKQEEAFRKLQEEASTHGIAVIRTPMGFTLAPVKDGQVLKPDVFASLPESEQATIRTSIEALESRLEAVLRAIPGWDKERRTQVRALNQETTRNAVIHLIEEVVRGYDDLPNVQEHLQRVQNDLVENIGTLLAQQQQQQGEQPNDVSGGRSPFGRYEVNLFVTRPPDRGAPVVEEPHPTLPNLVGRVEHIARQGVLATDFRLIKPGALHRANGGYLLLDARAILSEPFAWAALKRALKAREIRIENAVDLMSLTSTITLQPDPIPLDVKVVLFGQRSFYYLLSALDPEFGEHFKVLADFDDEVARTRDSERSYARLVATVSRSRGTLPLDREAVARVIERSARLADDAEKLTLIIDRIGDLLVEADFWARKESAGTVGAAHIEKAVGQQVFRMSRVRERLQESILREISLIDTSGVSIGQINGLSVYQLSGFAFGRPVRITARVSPGSGRVIDIEREVELGGPIHS